MHLCLDLLESGTPSYFIINNKRLFLASSLPRSGGSKLSFRRDGSKRLWHNNSGIILYDIRVVPRVSDQEGLQLVMNIGVIGNSFGSNSPIIRVKFSISFHRKYPSLYSKYHEHSDCLKKELRCF
jgi:hypothetical protein